MRVLIGFGREKFLRGSKDKSWSIKVNQISKCQVGAREVLNVNSKCEKFV